MLKTNKQSFFYKFILLILIVLIFNLINFNLISNLSINNFVNVSAKSNYTNYIYAKVENKETYLYKTNTNLSISNAYFEIPQTYFVLLLSNIDDVFYKVQYKDIVGFVLKSNVVPVAETPINPYLENINFRVFSSDGTSLLSSAQDKNSQVITTVETLKDIEYYGITTGEELIADRGSTWVYCKYSTENNSYYGYLYKGLCDSFSTITPNNEVVTPIPDPFIDNDNSYIYSLLNMSTFSKILIIILLLIPCIFILLLMFKPFKIEKKKNKSKLTRSPVSLNKIQKIIDDEPL